MGLASCCTTNNAVRDIIAGMSGAEQLAALQGANEAMFTLYTVVVADVSAAAKATADSVEELVGYIEDVDVLTELGRRDRRLQVYKATRERLEHLASRAQQPANVAEFDTTTAAILTGVTDVSVALDRLRSMPAQGLDRAEVVEWMMGLTPLDRNRVAKALLEGQRFEQFVTDVVHLLDSGEVTIPRTAWNRTIVRNIVRNTTGKFSAQVAAFGLVPFADEPMRVEIRGRGATRQAREEFRAAGRYDLELSVCAGDGTEGEIVQQMLGATAPRNWMDAFATIDDRSLVESLMREHFETIIKTVSFLSRDRFQFNDVAVRMMNADGHKPPLAIDVQFMLTRFLSADQLYDFIHTHPAWVETHAAEFAKSFDEQQRATSASDLVRRFVSAPTQTPPSAAVFAAMIDHCVCTMPYMRNDAWTTTLMRKRLVSVLADNPAAWALFWNLRENHEGSIGELLNLVASLA